MYKLFSTAVVRTPTLPFNKLESIIGSCARLHESLSDKVIQEAIYIASPTLYKEITKVLDGTTINRKEKLRVLYSATRYIARMSTRCTPFGLFTG